jgi:hypothetical protein
MKKYKLFLVVFILVLSIVGIARNNPVWASPKPPAGTNSSGVNSPLLTLKNITGNGIYNIGGVCTIEVEFKIPGLRLEADAEVPVLESQKVPFYSDGKLLFPGCHFVHFKQDELKQDKIVSPMSTEDGNSKVCFGASPTLLMTIYYYLDDPVSGSRVWIPLPTTLEDLERLVCAPALYTGVYMPAGENKIVPQTGSEQGGNNTPGGEGGSVLPPPSKITISGSGTYPVGGICMLTAKYKIKGLSDTVEVEYPSEDTLKVPSQDVEGLFYFPGCHVLHYRDQKIKDQMTRPEGDWQICFAAIPDKIMTIYYYQDDLTTIIGPWKALKTTTENGMACADLVYFTGVYTPAGK